MSAAKRKRNSTTVADRNRKIARQRATDSLKLNPTPRAQYEADRRLIRRRKGYYRTLKTGMVYNEGEDLHFLTLTTPDVWYLPPIFVRWRKLLEHLRHRRRSFEWLAQETNEGNGVLHIVTTKYLPVKLVRVKWDALNRRPEGVCVDIKRLSSDQRGKVVRYLVSQYLAGQNLFVDYRCSRGWLWKGATKDYKDFRRRCREEGMPVEHKQWDVIARSKKMR